MATHKTNSPEPSHPHKLSVLIAALCVAAVWSVMLAVLLVVLGAAVGMAFGMPSRTPLTTTGLAAIIGGYGLLMVSGIVYFVIALRLRCPFCEYKFLKNPKGFGPVNFKYHQSCPKRWGVNPWGYQIARFLKTRQMRCINCGKELFDAPSEGA